MTLTFRAVAGQERRLECVGEVIEVEDPHRVQLGDAVEVEIVGQDARVPVARQLDQLGVDRVDVGRVLIVAAQRPRAGPSGARPGPRDRAGRGRGGSAHGVGDALQLVDDEARHDQRSEQEAGGDDVGDAAVDERAGVDVRERPGTCVSPSRNSGGWRMPAWRSASAGRAAWPP